MECWVAFSAVVSHQPGCVSDYSSVAAIWLGGGGGGGGLCYYYISTKGVVDTLLYMTTREI